MVSRKAGNRVGFVGLRRWLGICTELYDSFNIQFLKVARRQSYHKILSNYENPDHFVGVIPSGFSKIPSIHSLMCSLQHSGAQGSPILLLFLFYIQGNDNPGVKQSAMGRKKGDFLNAGHCCGSAGI